MSKKVYFTTLGCSKNDVDTENMRSILENKYYQSVYDPEMADIIVINTCGFIDAAKEQSINEIFDMISYKENTDKKILVSGCLAQRYSDELLDEIPEIDGIIGTGEINNIEEYIEKMESGERVKAVGNINSKFNENLRKVNVNYSEYVKISEGCNNNCSYCVIPSLRGKNRSRRIEDIVDEVNFLVDNGAKEIILIAQNTTDYGIDIYGKYALSDLLDELEKIEKLKWLRVLYLYPDNFNDELIESFKNNDKLLPYVDIPLQHVNDEILENMNRRTDKAEIIKLIDKLRREIPDIIIRTTFIVGFPGETDEQFCELIEFTEDEKIDKVGVFGYSREENTKAYYMKNQIDEKTKSERAEKLMAIQFEISDEKLKKYLGEVFEIIIDEVSDEEIVGRTYMDIPDVDGVTIVRGNFMKTYRAGDFIKVKIVETDGVDMIGEVYESC